MEPAIVEKIADTLEQRKELRLYDYDSMSAGENFDDFITTEDVYERFEKLVMMSF